MRKSKFQDNAKPPGKTGKDDQASSTTVNNQPRPAAIGPRAPAPKSPFGMHVLPVAINIKPMATQPKKVEETSGDTK